MRDLKMQATETMRTFAKTNTLVRDVRLCVSVCQVTCHIMSRALLFASPGKTAAG